MHAGQGGDREGGERAILLFATSAAVEAARTLPRRTRR
jgi:hypothetical protein